SSVSRNIQEAARADVLHGLSVEALGAASLDVQRFLACPSCHDLVNHLGQNEFHSLSLETWKFREPQFACMHMHATVLCAARQCGDDFLRVQQTMRIKPLFERQEEIQLL